MPLRPELGGKAPALALTTAAVAAIAIKKTENYEATQPLPKANEVVTNYELAADETVKPFNAARLAGHARHHRRYRLHRRHHHLTPAQIADRAVSDAEFRAWSKVNVCEEGGRWHVRGSVYSGGLGISTVNWVAYGGREFAPTGADATPKEQIVIARRIQPNPPDQNGCDPGGW